MKHAIILAAVAGFALADKLTADQLAAKYGLTTSTILPFPSATGSSDVTQNQLVSQWSLSKGRVQNNPQDLSFVADPFPSSPAPGLATDNTTGPVLQVLYPAGSFTSSTSGAQFNSLWNTSGDAFQSMMISYDVAFDKGFDWVKGGKLPGLRGGPSITGCSGGNEPNGTDCFSARIMWRASGLGEVYAYIPTPNGICNTKSIECNDDFGVSISRGSFTFQDGSWNRITMIVLLNSPPDIANGHIELYFNDQQVLSQSDLQMRASTGVNANAMFFSTFFGGNDDSWATPSDTHTYFRNIQLFAGPNPSNLTGQRVSGAKSIRTSSASTYTAAILALLLGLALF